MSARLLAILTVCFSATRLQNTNGENIAFGKLAKQRSTYPGYPASRALNDVYSNTGSLTSSTNPSWWEVDLRGYYDISNITITAANNGWGDFPSITGCQTETAYHITNLKTPWGLYNPCSHRVNVTFSFLPVVHMRNAYIEVMDKDVSLCSDAQVEWCGNVTSTVARKEEFTFTCSVTFPIRFIRVTRQSTGNVMLNIGHIDVRGVGATKRYRSNYTPTTRRQVTKPSLSTSAITAGECGIFCHRNHSCIDFSYSKTAPAESNCLLTYEVVPQNSVAKNDWTMYTMDNCL